MPESEFLRLLYGQHGIDGVFLHANPPPKYLNPRVKKNETTPGSNRYKAKFAKARGYEWAENKGYVLAKGFKRPKYGQQGINGLFLIKGHHQHTLWPK
ncbi:MAG: hypothetical protein P8X89_16245 [Reinekea sp.]